MDAGAIVQIVGYAVALAFGIAAIGDWRRRGEAVSAGLGVAIDRKPAAAIGIGILIAERLAGGIAASLWAPDIGTDAGLGVFLAGNAVIDEILMRGMLISGLCLVLGGRPVAAVLIAAGLFGMTHMFFAGASPLSVLSNSLGGVAYGVAFVLTGRIWLGVGLHFAWNFVQGPVLGFIVSGHALGRGLFRIDDVGPDWLTGGTYGPEGGIVGLAMRFAVIGAVAMVGQIARRVQI